MKNIGIILAGGVGQRMGTELPKQFLFLATKTILEHSVAAFQSNSNIDEVFIITHADYVEATKSIINREYYPKVSKIVAGGSERYHSTLAALKACPNVECNLIIHDAVRPLVSQQMITACINELESCKACTIAIPSTDTILVSDSSHCYVKEIPIRSFLFNVQTPQAFKKSILEEAYSQGVKDTDFQSTDDCGVVKKYLPEIQIKIITGNNSNLKITYPEDLLTAEKILSTLNKL